MVLASEGYPVSYEQGLLISGLEKFEGQDSYFCFHAGTKRTEQGIVTNGGRVLGITAKGADLKQARANAIEVKCLQMHLTTDTADYERMVEQAKSFLAKGDKVKLSLRFRGKRELSNMNYAKDLMRGLLSRFDGLAVLDSSPVLNGKELSCVIRKA